MTDRKRQPILKPQTSKLKRFGFALLGFSLFLLPTQPCHGGIEGGSLSVRVDSFSRTDPVSGEVYNITVDWSYIFQSTLVGSDPGVVTLDSAHSGVFDPMHAPIFDWPGLGGGSKLFGSGVAPPGGWAELNIIGPQRIERSGEFQAEMPRYGFLNGVKTEIKFLYFETAGADLNYALHAIEPLNLGLIAYAPITWFPAPTFTVTPQSGDNGSIDPDSPQTVNSGSDTLFGATPKEGFVVDEWKVNDVVVQTGGIAYELKNVKADTLVSVTFKQAPGPILLDPTFSGDGKVTTDIAHGDDTGNSMVVQSDGAIVVAGASIVEGQSDFVVVRYNPNGTLDTSFNGTGKVTTDIQGGDDFGYSVALQSDGKIVVAGSSFNGNNYDFAAVRYNGDGSLDTTFNGTGKVTTDIQGGDDFAHGLAVESDGKIILAGSSFNGSDFDFAIVRYHPDGSLDLSLNGTGQVVTDRGASESGASVALQDDRKIIVVGSVADARLVGLADFLTIRYNPDGSMDSSFGNGGVALAALHGMDYASSVVLQGDGKVIVAGESSDPQGITTSFGLARYNTDGSLDVTFNGSGTVTTYISNTEFSRDVCCGVAVQPDGKIVAAGFAFPLGGKSHFAAVRYVADGSLDASFNETGKVTTDIGAADDTGRAVALQSDGKIVIAGGSFNGSNHDFALIRYEADILPPSAKLLNISTRMQVLTDDKMLIGGFHRHGQCVQENPPARHRSCLNGLWSSRRAG